MLLSRPHQDGELKCFWLQNAGIFKSGVFDQFERIKNYLDQVGRNTFCITASDVKGEKLWQAGTAYSGEVAYLSHAAERMMAVGDVDGDGVDEVVILDGCDGLQIFNQDSGKLKREVKLPADNFAIVYYIRTGEDSDDFIVLLGNSDRGLGSHAYGNPWMILNSKMEIVSQQDYLGAGHMVLIDDLNGDGLPEILIGYQLMNIKGEVLWTLDCMQGVEIDDVEQHLDYVDAKWVDGEWIAAMAGSDRLYLINAEGETLWYKKLPHPQFCLMGFYQGEMRIFLFNQRELMNIFTLDGTEVWRGVLPEYWPVGKPYSSKPDRPIHMNEPALRVENLFGEGMDGVVYLEGGWPYVLNFNGEIKMKIPYNQNIKPLKKVIPFSRLNDIGQAYEAVVSDVNGDEKPELIVYNREYAWVYSL